jgi:hypothetical protein
MGRSFAATLGALAMLFAPAFGALLVLLTADAEAGIYRCTGADGKTVFTGNPAACPNAKPHVLKKQVQTIVDDRGFRARQRRSRPAAHRAGPGAGGDGIEQMWRNKRPDAERRLQQAEQQLVRTKQITKFCNRGGELYRSGKSGIRKHVPCKQLHAEAAAAQLKRDELVQYLADGLEDECRRAGCQPGWVR